MTTYPFDPQWVIRPGLSIQEVLDEHGVSRRLLARMCCPCIRGEVGTNRCCVSVEQIDGIIDRGEPLTEQVAVAVSRLPAPGPQFWMNLERIYRDGLDAGKPDISDD